MPEEVDLINKEFSADCARWVKATPEEKAKREMRTRIVPFWKLEGGKRENRIMLVIYEWVKWWFGKHPGYPRCPMWFWGNFIKKVHKKKTWGHFATIIQRNDMAIENWIKFNK